jgi:superfamily II DNA or RNA helicase
MLSSLRPHQLEARAAIDAHFAAGVGGQRGLIKAFCGSGKSLIMTDSILRHSGSFALICEPSLSLVSQFAQDYVLPYLAADYEFLVVCSLKDLEDPDTPKEYKKKSMVTTDPAAITTFLANKSLKKGKIILCTYQSLDLLSPLGVCFTLACFDEAHVATAQKNKKLIFEAAQPLFAKALFFTATPINSNGIYMFNPDGGFDGGGDDGGGDSSELGGGGGSSSDIDEAASESNYDSDSDGGGDGDSDSSGYYDDDDEDTEDNEYSAENPHCGPLLFEYSHSRGVAEGFLSDFQIRLDLHCDTEEVSGGDGTGGGDVILFLFESMARAMFATGNFHALTFHSRVNGTDTDVSTFTNKKNKALFVKVVRRILRREFPHLEKYKDIHKNIRFEGFSSCSTTPAQRQEVLRDLGAAPLDQIFVIASQNTIGVGVDTKNANMVVFIDPKQSYVQIVQNVGRICRKQANGQKTTVLLPLCVSAAQYQEVAGDMVARDRLLRENMTRPDGDFTMILNVLSALRQADPHVFQLCLEYPHTFAPSELEAHFARHNVGLGAAALPVEELFAQHDVVYDPEVSEEDNFTELSHAQQANIQVTHAALTAENMDIYSGYDSVAHYVKTPEDTFVAGKTRTAAFLAKPRRQNVRPFVHCSPEMQVLWGITGNDLEGRELDNLDVFGAYIEATVIVNNKSAQFALFHKAVENCGADALKHHARVDEEGALVSKDADGWDDAWQIGAWFGHKKMELKDPAKKATTYASLTQEGTNKIVKANLEKFLADQAKPAFDKLALCFKAVENCGDKALVGSARVDAEGQLVATDADGWDDAWPVGAWFTRRKTEMKDPAKKAALYAKLTQDGTNEIVKAHLEKFLEDQAKPAVWHHDLTHEDKLALFHKTVEFNAKALAFNARVDEEGALVAKGADGWDDAWPIGVWFKNKKKDLKDPAKKAAVYDMLTQDGTNKIVKANLEKFLAGQAKPAVWHHDLTNEGKFALYYKAVELNDAKALVVSTARVDEEGALVAKGADGWDDAWPVGQWFFTQKKELKNPAKKAAVYDMLTQEGTNEIVKEHLDKFLVPFAHMNKFALCFKAVELNDDKALAQRARVDEEGRLVAKGADGWDDAWPVGAWFNNRKKELKDPAKKAATYAMLTQDGTNEIVKAHLEKFFAEQDKRKKRKASDDDVSEATAAEPPAKKQKRSAKKAPLAIAAPAVAAPAAAPEGMEVFDDVSEATAAEPPAKKQKRSVKKAPLAAAAAAAPEEPAAAPAENDRDRKDRKRRLLSELSQYHCEFNGKASARTQAHFQANPDDWRHYHDLLHASYDTYENPQAAVPVLRLIGQFEKKRSTAQKKVVVDLGCGLAEIGRHFRDSDQFDVISIDYVAADPALPDLVRVGNMRETGLPDGCANYVVFCLSLMGNAEDVEAYLAEARRILDAQGEVIVVEPRDSGRWMGEGGGEDGETCGKLRALLERHFVISKTKGHDEVYLYFYCRHKEDDDTF